MVNALVAAVAGFIAGDTLAYYLTPRAVRRLDWRYAVIPGAGFLVLWRWCRGR